MSQENVEVDTGQLLCAIGNAGRHLLGFRGFDFFVYERALAIVKVGASETYNAVAVAEEIRLDHGSAHQARLEAKAARPIQELLGANPGAEQRHWMLDFVCST